MRSLGEGLVHAFYCAALALLLIALSVGTIIAVSHLILILKL